jgi:hypothetical protein
MYSAPACGRVRGFAAVLGGGFAAGGPKTFHTAEGISSWRK